MSTCRTCPANLGPRNKSGYCQPCGCFQYYLNNPAAKEKARATLARNSRTPKATAARSAAAKRDRIWLAGQAACPAGSEARKRGGRRQSATKLAAIPQELREDYRQLQRKTKVPAAQAREIILAQHDKDMREFRRRIGA